MSLHEKLSRLRELEGKVPPLSRDANYLLYPDGDEAAKCRGDLGGQGEDWLTDVDLARFLCDLRNAAPAILATLDEIKPGDRQRLEEITEIIDFSIPSELTGVEEGDEELDFAPNEYKELVKAKAVLYRYRAMAAKMEEEGKGDE